MGEGGTPREQTADDKSADNPRAGESAVVRRASLGSFLMNVGDAPAIRVRREQ